MGTFINSPKDGSQVNFEQGQQIFYNIAGQLGKERQEGSEVN